MCFVFAMLLPGRRGAAEASVGWLGDQRGDGAAAVGLPSLAAGPAGGHDSTAAEGAGQLERGAAGVEAGAKGGEANWTFF